MKIYAGKNKKEAKEITLKELMVRVLKEERHKFGHDRFSDDSASWINVIQRAGDNQIEININFDPDDENKIEQFQVWETPYMLDHDKVKRIV